MKNCLVIFIVFLSISFLSAQTQNQAQSFMDRVHIGGGLNIGLGSSYSTISISPSVIYDISPIFSAGISATYMYSKNKSSNRETNVYGGGLIALINPIAGLQFSGEYERLKIKRSFLNISNNDYWNDAFYVGAAYRQGNMAIGLRYDLMYDKLTSIQSSALSPLFRIYF